MMVLFGHLSPPEKITTLKKGKDLKQRVNSQEAEMLVECDRQLTIN